MKELLAPAISYARNGFPVTEVIAECWARNARNLQKYPGFAETYMPNGRAPAQGRDVSQSASSPTRSTRSREGGRDAFYKGDIAQRIESYMRANGGFLTAEDLAAHRSEWVEPVSTNYRGYDVWELPPNTPGRRGAADPQHARSLRPQVHGLRQRRAPAPVRRGQEARLRRSRALLRRSGVREDPARRRLLSKEYAAKRRALITLDRAAREYPATPKALDEGDTIYLTVADADGNMVSLIQSNYRGMGSGMTPHGLRLHPAGPRRAVRARRTATPTRTRRASARSTPSFPRSSPRTASRGCRSASWAARCSRRATCRS